MSRWKQFLPKRTRDLVQLAAHARRQFVTNGWWRSYRAKRPIDREGNPLPWMTYSFIDFITPRLKPNLRVFEFGMGNSTLWWAQHCATVDCVENNRVWLDNLTARIPPNVRAVYAEVDSAAYVEGAKNTGHEFDIIVVDGRRRNECAVQSLSSLSGVGVFVWDNSERVRYAEGQQALIAHGFRRIDFAGRGPQLTRRWQTSIFYRDGNCLAI